MNNKESLKEIEDLKARISELETKIKNNSRGYWTPEFRDKAVELIGEEDLLDFIKSGV